MPGCSPPTAARMFFVLRAWQPQAAMPAAQKRLRTAVECRFIEHGRPPIYRVDTAGGRSPEELPDYQICYLTSFKLRCYTMKKHSCNLSTIWWRPSLHWAFFLRRTPLSCLWRITRALSTKNLLWKVSPSTMYSSYLPPLQCFHAMFPH